MTALMATPDGNRQARRPAAALGVLVLAASVTGGYLLVRFSLPAVSTRMLPWVAGRAFGLAAFIALSALVGLGVWMRHPWRHRWSWPAPEGRLRAHAALGSAVVVLLAGHAGALAVDRYAGVGWWGAVVPGLAHYRPAAVALGVVAAELLVVLVGTAALAGRLTGRHWLTVHRLAAPVFVLAWFHGVLAGSDTSALRPLYLMSGALLGGLVLTRYLGKEARR